MTPEERDRTAYDIVFDHMGFPASNSLEGMKLTDAIRDAIRDAEARGYRAAQEQAAEVAEDETGYLQSGGMDFGPNVPPRIAAAIRAMKPKETTGE